MHGTVLKRVTFLSICFALLAFATLSVVNIIIFHGVNERIRLESRFDSERVVSILFASLRSSEDFGSAIEGTLTLKEKVLGLGLYDEKGAPLYRWGATPETYAPPSFEDAEAPGDMARMYIENPQNDSVVLLIGAPKDAPPPPPQPPQGARVEPSPQRGPAAFDMMHKASVTYLEIKQTQFWNNVRLQGMSFTLVEVTLAAIVAFVGLLVIMNRDYRQRIENQKSLVTLGAVASALAHEIKNPLLAIRLQSSIISRTVPGAVQQELKIINSEVERLSALNRHVNDFLCDPVGAPTRVDLVEAACAVGASLCGRPIVERPANERFIVRIDAERLRSVLENLVRNALESGSPEEEVRIEIWKNGRKIRLDVLDRGCGIAPQDLEKVFDPFSTTKSRGSGIGLAICRRFVLAVGGSIALESRPGGGTRARVMFPDTD